MDVQRVNDRVREDAVKASTTVIGLVDDLRARQAAAADDAAALRALLA